MWVLVIKDTLVYYIQTHISFDKLIHEIHLMIKDSLVIQMVICKTSKCDWYNKIKRQGKQRHLNKEYNFKFEKS
jgi:hypothetical protein